MAKRFTCIFLSILLISNSLIAQTNFFTGWLILSHNQKISSKFNIGFESQLRSKNNLDGIKNIVLRPEINYNFNKVWSTGIAYEYTSTQTDQLKPLKALLVENAIVEQIVVNSNIKNLILKNRLRLEQRFIERQTQNLFSQRLRIYSRLNIPLAKSQKINNGIYLAFQNEIFLNIQNKSALNNNLFDQNRTILGFGHYFNSHFSSELDYQMIEIKGEIKNSNYHILQLTLSSKFGSGNSH